MRRLLCIAMVMVLLLTSVLLVGGCGKEQFTDFKITSSTEYGHTHWITIKAVDLEQMPAELTIESSYNGPVPQHRHSITLTKADLEAIKAKQTVTKTSTSSPNSSDKDMHTHTFTIKQP